jgi:hypothetical protein
VCGISCMAAVAQVNGMTTRSRMEVAVRTTLPAYQCRDFHLRKPDGELCTLTLLWTLDGHFRRRSESVDPAWRSLRFGPFVLAFLLTF